RARRSVGGGSRARRGGVSGGHGAAWRRRGAARRERGGARPNSSAETREMICVAVAGAAGRMGETVCAAVEAASDMELVGRADPRLGAGLAQILEDTTPDVVVDFSVPESVFENAALCLERGVHAVVGTTGIKPDQLERLQSAARDSTANCLIAPNFAIG